MPLSILPYNREKAVAYAHKWAYGKNPAYTDFTDMGGDCTNFASQCVFAGGGVMNYVPQYGWYYRSISDRTPSWSGVPFFYNFLVRNRSTGPFATETEITRMQPGDLIQLSFNGTEWQHCPVIVMIDGIPSPDTIYVAAHTFDIDYKRMSEYIYQKYRCIHIEGVRKYT